MRDGGVESGLCWGMLVRSLVEDLLVCWVGGWVGGAGTDRSFFLGGGGGFFCEVLTYGRGTGGSWVWRTECKRSYRYYHLDS